MLNLACVGRAFGGFPMGGYAFVIGDSTSGKTVLAGTCLAEAAMSETFKDYDLYFDNVENGAMFFEKFFGQRIAARIKPPGKDGVSSSRTVEDFYANIHRALHNKDGSLRKIIYILDSEPALSSKAEEKKQGEQRKAHDADKEAAGTMTDAKAKVHSQNMRSLNADLRDSNSLLVILTQTRDNMGFGAIYEPKTRPGGKALKFYAQLEMWLSVRGRIKRTVRGKPREIGIVAEVKVKKNRFTGKSRTVLVPIYTTFGIDDMGSCIDFLIEEKHWSGSEGRVNAPEFKFNGAKEKLIQTIEAKNEEKKLRGIVRDLWNEIEAACEVPRKQRYA